MHICIYIHTYGCTLACTCTRVRTRTSLHLNYPHNSVGRSYKINHVSGQHIYIYIAILMTPLHDRLSITTCRHLSYPQAGSMKGLDRSAAYIVSTQRKLAPRLNCLFFPTGLHLKTQALFCVLSQPILCTCPIKPLATIIISSIRYLNGWLTCHSQYVFIPLLVQQSEFTLNYPLNTSSAYKSLSSVDS